MVRKSVKGTLIQKSTFREIRSSFGRFMAIFAIVALGVGFFAGLTVAKSAMLLTVKDYLNQHAFYDLRLISTLGFDRENAAELAGEADAVESAVSFDILYHMGDGNQGVVKAYSMTQQINTLKLRSGRFPQESNECLADSKLFPDSAVGSVIYLSEDNKEEDLEHFAFTEYTIVGTVQSPLYLQYERGNTSLGTGRLDGFVYMPRDGFDVEYDTEIYVRFDREYALYSKEYNEFIDKLEPRWKVFAQQAANRRYGRILDEAERELADAEQEFAEKKAEGEAELADAAKTLADAGRELAEGEQALADAKAELADGERTLEEKERELADARVTIAEKEQELAEAKETIAEKEEELRKGEEELAEGKRQWEKGDEALEAGKQEVAQRQAELAEQAKQLAEQKQGLQAAAFAGLISEQELVAGLLTIEEGEKIITAYQAQLDQAVLELEEGDSQLVKAWEEIQEGERQLAEGREALADGKAELAEGEKALADARTELAEGAEAIEEAKAELAEGRETLREKEVELADGKKEYEEGEEEYEDALKEYEEKIGEAETELADARDELSKLEEPQIYVLGRDANVGYVCFENDADIVAGIANIFPLFFFLVAALVCITTMNRMVEEQRTQIGVLKALGYGEAAIMSKYMTYSGLAAVTGCFVGYFVGTWGFPKVVWYGYGIMYQANPIVYLFDWKLAVISLAVSLLCSMGTTWLSCRVELAQVAAALMRPKAPKAGKRVFLERIPFLWKRLGFLRKVSLRNIFRYKKRLFMMVVGISGCTALLVTGFGIKDSIGDVARMQFEEIQIFDLSASLQDNVDEGMLETLRGLEEAGIDSFTCVMEKNMDFVGETAVESVILITGTAEEMPNFVDFRTENGDLIPYPELGEAVISDKLAREYHVRAGEQITLRDEDMRTFSVTVAAVYENYIYDYVHVSEATWREQMGEEPEKKTVYFKLSEEPFDIEGEALAEGDGFALKGDSVAAAHVVSAALMQMEEVVNVTVNQDTMKRIGNMMASLDMIVAVVILCAAGLAFIVLYNLTNINITERIREIATIKVLGFYKKETASYVFRENLLLTGMGTAAGLLLGIFLHRFVMSEVQVDLMNFDVYVKPISYCYSAVLTIIFAWFVDKVMEGKLERISMTESLKSVD